MSGHPHVTGTRTCQNDSRNCHVQTRSYFSRGGQTPTRRETWCETHNARR